MFSPQIVGSDVFLDMPQSSQLLYFHLSMSADDDGFVGSPKKTMRMIGAAEDDIKILIAKEFVISFKSGVVVIRHWKMNNLIRKDWYRETQYMEEKKTLTLANNGLYSNSVNEPLTKHTRPVNVGSELVSELDSEKEAAKAAVKQEPNPETIKQLNAIKEKLVKKGVL